MSKLPLIVGFGGISPAGRSSFHHGYRRLLLDHLSQKDTLATKASLARLMNLSDGIELTSSNPELDSILRSGTLVRQLENNLFDPNQLLSHQKMAVRMEREEGLNNSFIVPRKHLPRQIPINWTVSDFMPSNTQQPSDENLVRIECAEALDVLVQDYRKSPVNSAGQLPTGFRPESLYQSRNHPRGLQMTLFAASDAIQSMGISWQTVMDHVAPDQVSVYAGSGMSQLDYNGNGGMMKARLLGRRVTSKQLALGYSEMPADFINAYVLGNLGTTGTNVAACATFLYNLRQGIRDIHQGTHRVVVIGTSEAPLVAEIFDGYSTMGALADDAALLQLDKDKNLSQADHRRACRPFGNNAGFTLSESAQCVVLFDDELAMELGANIYGAINDVFVNADGFKKSIAGPGVGNYITVAKAAAATKNIIGEEGLQQRSYVQAHGTGTPQNRVTESHIMSTIAKTFNIDNWPVTALKSYIGHSLASSAGDQLALSLGLWKYGVIPGIRTTEQLADDVCTDNLDILLDHKEVGEKGMDAVLLNSKGFGGNNATASILAPHIVEKMLGKKYGKDSLTNWQKRNEKVKEESETYDQMAIAGKTEITYKFNHNVLDGDSLKISEDELKFKGIKRAVDLRVKNHYGDMCD